VDVDIVSYADFMMNSSGADLPPICFLYFALETILNELKLVAALIVL
jgi:hypothetical protein